MRRFAAFFTNNTGKAIQDIQQCLSYHPSDFLGLVHDVNKSYSHALHTASTMSISCVILWGIDGLIKRRKENTGEILETVGK